MKKNVLTFLLATAAPLLLLLTPSCSGLVSPSVPDSPADSDSQKYTLSGSFSMPSTSAAPAELYTFNSNPRNAIPDIPDLIYTVKAVRTSDGYTKTTSSDGSTYTFTDLTAGTWRITAYAKKSNGTLVMQSGTKPVTLSNATPAANESLAMGPASGTGGIDIAVSWAADSKIGYCTWAFSGITNSGNNTNSSFNITAESIPSGTYALTLDFYTSDTNATNGAKPIYSCTEYVSVYPGLTTDSWAASTAPHIDSDGNFSVTKECVETFVYRKIYVKQGADDSTATGTSERPFPTIEKAMERLTEAASKGIRSGEISAETPWELHVTGTPTAPTSNITGNAIIDVNSTIGHLAIIGEGSGATIDANSKGRIVYVSGGASVTMQDVTLTNGSSDIGGAVYIDDGTFTMESGTITGNSVSDCGGGVFVSTAETFVMNGGTIINNSATNNEGSGGGGVYTNGNFTMNSGTITENLATKGNGVAVADDGIFTMNGGTITANTYRLAQKGGGVYCSGSFTMAGGTISGNKAKIYGGGVHNEDGTFILTDGTISGNKVEKTNRDDAGIGGGVYNKGTFTMDGGTISGNQAVGFNNVHGDAPGGGVYNEGTFTMNDGTISGNKSRDSGGGVYNSAGHSFTMKGGNISGNGIIEDSAISSWGGGVCNNGTFTMTGGNISSNTVSSNSSTCWGGGVCIIGGGTFDMQNGTITGNTVKDGGSGSGVYVHGSATFKMKGNARVAPSNNVYLCSGRKITISGDITAESPAATITPEICKVKVTVLTQASPNLLRRNHEKFAVSDSTCTIDTDGNIWKTSLASLTQADMEVLIADSSAKDSSYTIMTLVSSERGSKQWRHMIGTKYVVKTTAGRYCTLEITGISDDNVWVHTKVRPAGETTVHSWSFFGDNSDIDAALGVVESGRQTAKNDIHVDNGTPNSTAKFYIMDYVYTP